MRKYRVNTTISLRHKELLQKQVEKHGTQQKAIENALENLENNSNQSQELFQEEKLWLGFHREGKGILTIFPNELTRILIETADIEYFREYIKKVKQAEAALNYYYNKPLKDFSLPELVEGIILNIKLQGSSDTLNYTEENGYYEIYLTHRLGINVSKSLKIMNESVFDSYRAKYETYLTERSVFFKIYK